MSVIMSKVFTIPIVGTAASDLAVGSSVWLNVNGTLTEFLVVHQGNPDASMYDNSCDGTWLLMKDIYTKSPWNTSDNNDYSQSDVHFYLNTTFLNLFDAETQAQIKTVKIPYAAGYPSSEVNTGTNGLSTKIFLLSSYEAGLIRSGAGYGEYDYVPVDGVCLSYFKDTVSGYELTKAYYNGVATEWFHRSIDDRNNYCCMASRENGHFDIAYTTGDSIDLSGYGIRPALILPPNAKFDPDTMEFVEV